MKASIFVSIVAVLLIGCATTDSSTKTGSAGTLASRLVGTWQALEIVDTDPAGKVSHPYGEHPVGYIVYDATGHLHVQLMRTPATPPFAAGDEHGTDREVRAAYDGYVAYFGTYEVDEAQGKVVHRVQGRPDAELHGHGSTQADQDRRERAGHRRQHPGRAVLSAFATGGITGRRSKARGNGPTQFAAAGCMRAKIISCCDRYIGGRIAQKKQMAFFIEILLYGLR